MLEHLNPEQRQAVVAGGGPLLVLAGAGSGKTRVLTTRIAHLIQERGVPPYRILAFTFTNKAAREMRERVERALAGAAGDVWIGTFHSTGVRILRREATRLGWERNFAIYDTADSEAVIKDVLSSHTLTRHVSPGEARGAISSWKNDRIGPEAAAAEAADDRQRFVAQLYAEYQKALRRSNAFDFDDLIAKPVELFEAQPEVLQGYAQRFQYVLVDEFQDTNTIQMQFIEQLASGHGNLFVVGDDDQSIYAWRGARIDNILRFDTRFQGTAVIRLEQNYRSTSAILQAANHVIAHNRGRKGKNLWTSRQGGDPIRVVLTADEEEEGLRVAQLVQELIGQGRSRNDIAVLYRTNAQSRALEDMLRRANIPYQIVGGTRFYERKEVRDIVGYLKAIHNPADAVALHRILNVPKRGIGATTIGRLVEAAAARDWTLGQAIERPEEIGLSSGSGRKVAQFGHLLLELRGLALQGRCVDVVQAVIESTAYFEHLKDADPVTFQARRENVEELVSAAQAFADANPDDASLGAFLEEISLLSDIDQMQERVDQVTLMTLHSAKGLEFPVVVITGLEEGLLPHSSSQESLADLEEERRLFYVGMTRAEDQLWLMAASNRRRYGDYEPMMQSRFLGELPEEHVEIEAPRSAGAARRSAWASRQPSWRSYAEGDPDTYWRRHGDSDDPPPHETYDDDVSQEAVTLQIGMRVRHEKFGVGQVLRIEGTGDGMKVTVVFGRSESKKFVARYARLQPVR